MAKYQRMQKSRKRNNSNLYQQSEDTELENEKLDTKRKKQKLNNNDKENYYSDNEINMGTVKTIRYNKCTICNQRTSQIKARERISEAVDEVIALADKKLSLMSDNEFLDDFRPTYKLINFSIYDANDHLCRFDTGLIESNIHLFCSGDILPIFDANSSNLEEITSQGVPAEKIGPINEWYMTGFDGGPNQPVVISTPYAEYYLMEPVESYKEYMKPVIEKIYLSKIVIEFLTSKENPTYEDLLDELQTAELPEGVPRLTEESLLKNAQFICNQVTSLDISSEEDDNFPLLTTSCMRSLIKLTGASVGNDLNQSKINETSPIKKKSSQVILTKLIHNIVNKFVVKNQSEDKDIFSTSQLTACGRCKECKKPPCGICSECNKNKSNKNDKTKVVKNTKGKSGSKQNCLKRKCLNRAREAIEDDSDEDCQEEQSKFSRELSDLPEMLSKMKTTSKKIKWSNPVIFDERNRSYYNEFSINLKGNSENICINSFVKIKLSSRSEVIVKIISVWENDDGKQKAHVNCFYNSRDTILGNLGDKYELFSSDLCADIPLSIIDSSCNVIYQNIPANWTKLGNTEPNINKKQKSDEKTYFFKMHYIADSARFEYPDFGVKSSPKLPESSESADCTQISLVKNYFAKCAACQRRNDHKKLLQPQLLEPGEVFENNRLPFNCILYKNEEYRLNNGIYISASFLKFKYKFSIPKPEKPKLQDVDEELYPEYYRKYLTGDHVKGSNYDTPEPFVIGCIKAIYLLTYEKHLNSNSNDHSNTFNNVNPDNIRIIVNKMYRSENTHKGPALMSKSNINFLFWSNEECEIPFSAVMGRCKLTYCTDTLVDDWSREKLHEFYFNQAYDAEKEDFYDLLDEIKSNSSFNVPKIKKSSQSTVNIKPLRTLDIFSGCGGLSHGLSTSGIADVCWAIEKDSAAAKAFIKNHSNVQMYEGDCNSVLNKIFNNKSPHLPKKGDIELLCGGPPCQGFSGLNRFNCNQYSYLKNALLFTFLSYCDYFRPRFVVMENVKNFTFHHKGLMLKLAMYCFLQIGYQCTFAILQAGNFGLPQARRRIILLAAAPGSTLPSYPEPLHVFSKRTCQLDVVIDGKKYSPNFCWKDSAPYRTISVRDAIGDLPEIKNGDSRSDMTYENDATTHFQRKMRKNKVCGDAVMDHIAKKMSALVEARIESIPKSAGADWRDLPNVVVHFNDGSATRKLEYKYKDSSGKSKGVCFCAIRGKCDPNDRQENTLIPWCLPHTSHRHNGWAGTYGRLDWDGFFGTTVTNPEPLGKQGRVLHPEQSRVVSIRECARSQGFPDHYCFHGSVVERYRQIGNAVPPPFAEAIGNEIKKVL